MKKTQIDWVKEQLKESGEITRNQCLSNFISRLSAIIQNLEEEGYVFETHHRKGYAVGMAGDYVYKLVDTPKKPMWRYDLVDGVRVPRLTYEPKD